MLDDISNIRYKNQCLHGCCLVNSFTNGTVAERDLFIKQHATENVYIYVLTNDASKKLEKISQAVGCIHLKLGRNVYSINYKVNQFKTTHQWGK